MKHLILLLVAAAVLFAAYRLTPAVLRGQLIAGARRNARWLVLAVAALVAIVVASFYLPALPILK